MCIENRAPARVNIAHTRLNIRLALIPQIIKSIAKPYYSNHSANFKHHHACSGPSTDESPVSQPKFLRMKTRLTSVASNAERTSLQLVPVEETWLRDARRRVAFNSTVAKFQGESARSRLRDVRDERDDRRRVVCAFEAYASVRAISKGLEHSIRTRRRCVKSSSRLGEP